MKLILYKINGSYLLKGGSGQDFLIDGREVKSFTEGWLEEKPKEVKVKREKRRAVAYGDLTPEEFNKKKENLLKKAVSYDEYNELLWATLEDEYKKFIQEHPAKIEKYIDYEECEIIEYDITGRTDIKWIKPFRFIGENPVNNRNEVLYLYNPYYYEMAQEIAKKYGFEEVKDSSFTREDTLGKKWSVPDHSRGDLRFLKINGHYPFKKGLTSIRIKGTFDECYKQFQEDYRKIEKVFRDALTELEAKGKSFDKAKVIVFLRDVKRRIKDLDIKRKDYVAKKVLLEKIEEFINII